MAYIPNIQICDVHGLTVSAHADTLEGGRRFAWVAVDLQGLRFSLFHPSHVGPEEWVRSLAQDMKRAADSLLSAAGGQI